MGINTRHFRPALAEVDPGLLQAQCWEDEALVVRLLAGPEPTLSVIEGGDSVIALALAGTPVRVVGAPWELALLELKLAGRYLEYTEHLQLVGALKAGRRLILYHQIRDKLSPATRQYWDQNEAMLRVGLLSSGRFERRLTRIRERVLPLVLPQERLHRLLSVRDMAQQRAQLELLRGSLRWRGMDALVRDMPGLRLQIESVLERVLVHECGALLWLFLGYYPDIEGAGRRYLSAQGHRELGQAAGRIEVLSGALQQHLGGFTKVHFGRGGAQGMDRRGLKSLAWGAGPGVPQQAHGLLGPGCWVSAPT